MYQARKVSGHVFMYVEGIDDLSLSTILIFYFRIVPRLWYFLLIILLYIICFYFMFRLEEFPYYIGLKTNKVQRHYQYVFFLM
jgi:hypothetical protein